MESIDLGQDFTAIVDFAHTPNALRSALQTARQLAGSQGRIIAVFGSAGLRDREKRRMMPEVAAQYADLTVLTAEDPRTESLAGILDEMADALQAQGGVEGKSFWRIADRGAAIRAAVEMAQTGDLVIVCGKGHEQSMCFGATEYAWDDRQALRSILADYLGLPGPQLPYLPTQDGKM
jgi:UDP-N-acetylmuramoyl-L-alanyl-D-glutamate--2,6-diaminopimelate ligase